MESIFGTTIYTVHGDHGIDIGMICEHGRGTGDWIAQPNGTNPYRKGFKSRAEALSFVRAAMRAD